VSDEYEVGYGKPPAKHRFKPGNQAARGRGKRRKHARSMSEILAQAMNTKRKIKRGDKVYSMPVAEILIERVVQMAMGGSARDVAALMAMIERHSPSLLANEPEPLQIELHRAEGSQVELPSPDLWDTRK